MATFDDDPMARRVADAGTRGQRKREQVAGSACVVLVLAVAALLAATLGSRDKDETVGGTRPPDVAAPVLTPDATTTTLVLPLDAPAITSPPVTTAAPTSTLPAPSTSSTSTSRSTPSSTTTTAAQAVEESPPVTPSDADPVPAELSLTLTLETTVLRRGGELRGRLTARNTSTEEMTLTHSSGCKTEEGLYLAGEFMGGAPHQICTAAVTTTVIRPGEEVHFEIRLDDLARRPDGSRPPLPPGPYDAAANLQASGKRWYAPPIRVHIKE